MLRFNANKKIYGTDQTQLIRSLIMTFNVRFNLLVITVNPDQTAAMNSVESGGKVHIPQISASA